MLEKTESLDTYHQFNGENPLGSFKIEDVLQITGLNTFLDEMNALFKESSPFLNQVSLLFTHYRRQLASLRIEMLNNLAAKQLLQDFGVAGIGIDDKGNADSLITQQILSVHGKLVVNLETTSTELPSSVAKFTTFIVAVQKEIIRILVDSQKSISAEIEAKETEETKVDNHLSSHTNTHHRLASESIQVSRQAQEKRKKATHIEKESAHNQLKTLFSYLKNIFNPVAMGTREFMSMTAQ